MFEPVSEGATGEGRIQAGVPPGGAAIATWHLGAHDILGEAYGRLAAWLEENEREAVGPSWGGLIVDRREPGARPVVVTRTDGAAHGTRAPIA
jgi:effector-binding domain-containing protein